MQTQVTVYSRGSSLRVVRGDHTEHLDARKYAIRVYPSAALAYGNEVDASVRSALLLIDPTCDAARVGEIKRVLLPRRLGAEPLSMAQSGRIPVSMPLSDLGGCPLPKS